MYKHPAKFNRRILECAASLIEQECGAFPVIYDPFCGVGTVRLLRDMLPNSIVFGSELEPEWAKQWDGARVADATCVRQMRAAAWGYPTPTVICSSPPYDNGMNDSFRTPREKMFERLGNWESVQNEVDKIKEGGGKVWKYNTYREHLGRALHHNNMGAYNSRGSTIDEYLRVARAAAQNISDLFPRATIVWNTKSAYRTQKASKLLRDWETVIQELNSEKVMVCADTPLLWRNIWIDLGYMEKVCESIESPGNRQGENRHRFKCEQISVYTK